MHKSTENVICSLTHHHHQHQHHHNTFHKIITLFLKIDWLIDCNTKLIWLDNLVPNMVLIIEAHPPPSSPKKAQHPTPWETIRLVHGCTLIHIKKFEQYTLIKVNYWKKKRSILVWKLSKSQRKMLMIEFQMRIFFFYFWQF